MQATPSGRRSVVEGALVDYHRSPGKFALLRREPKVLFGSIKDVLQLAAGRAPDGGSVPVTGVQQAACFFVRTALLHPNADHYALLGIERNASADAIKERYRLMMRLMHPDFAPPGTRAAWPPDSAARVNRAYEVLSSPDQRKAYDERGKPAPSQPAPMPAAKTAQALREAAARPPAEDPRRGLKVLAAGFGAAGVLLFLGVLGLVGGSDRESLVQRNPPLEPPPQTAAAAAAPSLAQASAAEPANVMLEAPPPLAVAMAPADSLQLQAAPMLRAPAASPAALPRATPDRSEPARPYPAVLGAAAPPVVTAPPLVPAVPAVQPAPVVTVAPEPAAAPPPVVVAVAPAAAPRPNPGVTLAEVHPLLARLVQQVESGTGERMLGLLERDARSQPSAQALVRQYNSLVDGAGPVKVSHVQFRSEPLEGRLLVTGYLVVEVGVASTGAAKEFSLQAEFMSRDGVIVMTRLSRAQARQR